MLADLREDLRPGSVVLMHDGIGPGALRDDPAETIALIEPLDRADPLARAAAGDVVRRPGA